MSIKLCAKLMPKDDLAQMERPSFRDIRMLAGDATSNVSRLKRQILAQLYRTKPFPCLEPHKQTVLPTGATQMTNHEARIANLEQSIDQLRCRNCELWVLAAFLLGAQMSSGWTFWQFLFAVFAAAAVIVFMMRHSSSSASLDELLGRYPRSQDQSTPPSSATN
jgi:hypothetical protein